MEFTDVPPKLAEVFHQRMVVINGQVHDEDYMDLIAIANENERQALLAQNLLKPVSLESLKPEPSSEYYPVQDLPSGNLFRDTPLSLRTEWDLTSCTELIHKNLDNPNPTLNDLMKLDEHKKDYPLFYNQLCIIYGNENFSKDEEKIRIYIEEQLAFVYAERLLVTELGLFDKSFILIEKDYELTKVIEILTNTKEYESASSTRITQIAEMAFELSSKLKHGISIDI